MISYCWTVSYILLQLWENEYNYLRQVMNVWRECKHEVSRLCESIWLHLVKFHILWPTCYIHVKRSDNSHHTCNTHICIDIRQQGLESFLSTITQVSISGYDLISDGRTEQVHRVYCITALLYIHEHDVIFKLNVSKVISFLFNPISITLHTIQSCVYFCRLYSCRMK